MPLALESLPLTTALDPTEEPPGSIDPLGTLSTAERLADIFLPGFTARMRRVRLLTFTAVSSAIADRVVANPDGGEENRLEARLALERLYVSAIVRFHQKDPVNYVMAKLGLPGTDLARKALAAGEPLVRGNFLKGQAVNGPFGVMARLARKLELVDGEDNLGRNGLRLLLAWAEDQQLTGLLDDNAPVDRPGVRWAVDVARSVSASLKKKSWPGAGQKIWEQLVVPLRLDEIGQRERQVLSELLEADVMRRRMIEILRDTVQTYRTTNPGNGRGLVERTVRWDQLPVRVPGGVQHAKATLLIWERMIRLIVASANLTSAGYRRNREIVGVLDLFNDASSTPLQVSFDALDFFGAVARWIRAADGVVRRLQETINETGYRLRGWRNAPIDFSPRELPRVSFVSGLPCRDEQPERSPLTQAIALWGNRRAEEIVVMTPFVGDVASSVDPGIRKLMEIPRTRGAVGSLIVPGRPSESDQQKMLTVLPRRFLQAWASAWRYSPHEAPTYVVPLCRQDLGEKVNRDLHAKGVFVAGSDRAMLLCGSSNFSPHGMGVGVSNIEANLCYLDESDAKRGGIRLKDRLPVRWDADYAPGTVWPETPVLPEEDEMSTRPRLPAVFLWAVHNPRSAQLVVALDQARTLPLEWSIGLPGENRQESLVLTSYLQTPALPHDGRLTIQLPETLRGAHITGLRVTWTDPEQGICTALLPVQVENHANLLPPEEFQALTADVILACLLSGRDPAEWVEITERRQAAVSKKGNTAVDSLRAVDTTGYLLYRMRRVGRGLATLGERLLRTVRTRDALLYRLEQDPLGPSRLAEALVRDWGPGQKNGQFSSTDRAALLFALAEIILVVAHVGQRMYERQAPGEPDLRPVFRTFLLQLYSQCQTMSVQSDEQIVKLLVYFAEVKERCEHLIGPVESGGGYAC